MSIVKYLCIAIFIIMILIQLPSHALGATCRYSDVPHKPSELIGKVVEWRENGITGYAMIVNAWSAFGDKPGYGRGATQYYSPGLYYFGSSIVYAFELKPDPSGDVSNDSAYCYGVQISDFSSPVSFLDIISFTAEPQTITASYEAFSLLSWTVSTSSNSDIQWQLNIAGKSMVGIGSSVKWDVRNDTGDIVPPGLYTANLTIRNPEGCSDSQSLNISVDSPPIEICDSIDNNGNGFVDEVCWGKGYLNTSNGVKAQDCR